MGIDASAVENSPISQAEQPHTEKAKRTPDQIADEVLRKREAFRAHKEKLEAEALGDANEIAERIAEANTRAELEKARTETEKVIASENVKSKTKIHPKLSGELTPPIHKVSKSNEEPKPVKQSLKDTAKKLVWKTKLGFTMLAQFGALHPSRVDGKWVTVLEPWARTHDDPRQKEYSNESEYYAKLFSKTGERIIDMPKLGGDSPSITLDGIFGGIQLLDHRRIHEAKNQKKAIVVNVVNFEKGVPKSFN